MSLESENGRAGTPERAAAPEPERGPAEGPEQSGQRWRLLDDPVAIRALAHPLRHDLMSIIGRLGRATTADAARELGISHGLASHHLRQLAKYGFVEQVKGKDHRERPWRLVATSYNWTAATATAEGSTAVDVLEQLLAEGGPHLLGQLVEAGLMDELCLTIGPLMAGPGASRIVAGSPAAKPQELTLAHVLEDNGFLLCRYTRKAQ